jgi:RsiW-degrading membrane proteinase PrsW (M82 family)
MTFQPIKFLESKKVRVPLAILNTIFFLSAILLYRHFQSRGFLFLCFATLFLLQMPYFYNNWMKNKKSERPFFVVMGMFIFGFLAMAIFIFTLAF